MNTLTVVLQSALGLSLLLLAAALVFKARWLQSLVAPPPRSRIGHAAVSALCALAGLATLLGMVVPFTAFFAACLALLASAFFAARAVSAKLPSRALFPGLLAMVSVAVAVAQPLGLKVLALPKADDLPYAPATARVVKTYDEGLGFEGIAVARDGTLYLAGNRGLDFARSDYYRQAEGEIIARHPDGSEQVLFKTSRGHTAGVIAVAPDGALYMTSHGDVPAIWRLAPSGRAEMLVQLPRGAWPNGLDIGPDGKLYTPDSALGVVWRVDPVTRQIERVIDSTQLKARSFISLAPGANGLHFHGRDMFVTVSDRTTVLRYRLDENGRFGAATRIASGIPGDDFAVGHDGTLFITTHPYNTLVRVAPDGTRTVVGKEAQHLVGATDAAFGRGADDRNTLYVVTDGGAFTAGPKARGQLVALQFGGEQ